MKLFKNGVGRPSNETLQKRRMVYVVIVIVLVVLVGIGVFYTVKQFKSGSIFGESKNASLPCSQPYTVSKCSNEGTKNGPNAATIKKLQQMLQEAGFYKGSINGNYDNKTGDAVKSAKKKYGLKANKVGDAALVDKMAPIYGYAYTTITYVGMTKPQFVMKADVPLYSTSIGKRDREHIGWTATSVSRWSKTKYYYGCDSIKCSSPKMFTEAKVKSLGSNFHPYVFNKEETVNLNIFNALDGVYVTLNALYCSSVNATYSKSTSSCSKGNIIGVDLGFSSTTPTTPTNPTTPSTDAGKPTINSLTCSNLGNITVNATDNVKIKKAYLYTKNGVLVKTANVNSSKVNSPLFTNLDYGKYRVSLENTSGISNSEYVTCEDKVAPTIHYASCILAQICLKVSDRGGIQDIYLNNSQKRNILGYKEIENCFFTVNAGNTYFLKARDTSNNITQKEVTCPKKFQ